MTDTLNGEALYTLVRAAGVEIDHHETDLYIPYNDITRGMIDRYEYKANVTTFVSQIDGTLWYDIPFAYIPAWERKPR